MDSSQGPPLVYLTAPDDRPGDPMIGLDVPAPLLYSRGRSFGELGVTEGDQIVYRILGRIEISKRLLNRLINEGQPIEGGARGVALPEHLRISDATATVYTPDTLDAAQP